MAEVYNGTEGDDALAGGYAVMDGDEDWRDGWKAINRTRDFIARLKAQVAAISLSWGSITGKPATFPPSAHTHNADAVAVFDTNVQSALENAFRGSLWPDVYNRTLSGSWRSLYVSTTGTLGWVSSSRRSKTSIAPASVDVDAVLAMEVVTFLYKASIDPTGTVQHGLIAEQLHDLGLTWLVDYGTGEQPEGVKYDLLALALLPAVQDAHAKLDALAARVTALEAS